MSKWTAREVDWDRDSTLLRDLFATAWEGHPITTENYFRWQLSEYYKGNPIAYCAEPESCKNILAGIYLVLPTTLLVDEKRLEFSTAVYSITHPSFYRKGVYKSLANLTYEKCSKIGVQGTVGVPNNDV